MRCVLVIALQFTGVDIDRQSGVRIQVVARTIVGNPGRRIPGAPVCGVRRWIKYARDPDGTTSALVSIAFPSRSARLIRRRHRVGAPNSLAGFCIKGAYRGADTKFATRVTHKKFAPRSERRQRRIAAGLPVIDRDGPDFLARGGIESD